MRDVVEIGLGRQARRTYSLDEVEIVPTRRTRSSKEVSVAWQIDAYQFDIPLMAHPSDAVMSPESAIEFGSRGGMAVLNAEGLWGRCADPQGEINRITAMVDNDGASYRAAAALQELHRRPIDHDLLGQAVTTIQESGITTAVRVSPQNARILTPVLLKAGIDLLIVQGTIISAEHVGTGGDSLNLKDFIHSLDVPVIAGGVGDYQTAMHLMRTGAAGVIVGYGSGFGCTTTDRVLGMGVRMATAIADAAAARREYLDETGGRYVHVIADGDINESGDISRAVACGADAVMLGHVLAEMDEAPGGGCYWPSVAAHPSLPRGELSRVRGDGAGAPLEEILHGPTSVADGSRNLVGGLQRAMAKCGFTELKGFQKVDISVGS